MQRKFERSFDSLTEIVSFTDEALNGTPIQPAVRYAIDVAIDELFTNMVKYNARSPARIGLGFGIQKEQVSVTLIDYQSNPFDITQPRPVDIHQAAEQRPIGGLGIHIVQQMVDSLEYHFEAGVSTIKFTKRTGTDDV